MAIDDFVSLREHLEGMISTLRREVDLLTAHLSSTIVAHNSAHDREHAMTQIAVTKAEDSIKTRLGSMNEWREESKARVETYPTKSELAGAVKRLEDAIDRNSSEIDKVSDRFDERLKRVETFVISFQAQIGTLRALVVLIPTILAIIGFALTRIGS